MSFLLKAAWELKRNQNRALANPPSWEWPATKCPESEKTIKNSIEFHCRSGQWFIKEWTIVVP